MLENACWKYCAEQITMKVNYEIKTFKYKTVPKADRGVSSQGIMACTDGSDIDRAFTYGKWFQQGLTPAKWVLLTDMYILAIQHFWTFVEDRGLTDAEWFLLDSCKTVLDD